jgi:hypothetical protein
LLSSDSHSFGKATFASLHDCHHKGREPAVALGPANKRDFCAASLATGPQLPRYFFQIFDGVSMPDLEGTECADIYVAQSEALRMSGEIMRDLGSRFWDGPEWRLEVTDADGRKLFVIRFSAEEMP